MTDDLVRLTVGQQFPDLSLERIELIGSGWEFDVYLVDGHRVIRFPRYAEVAAGLDRAEAILEFVATELGSAVRVPRVSLRGEPTAHFPHSFFGHEFIPGIPASDPRVRPSPSLARDLGCALSRIHGISPAHASLLGIGPQKWYCRTSFEALLEGLAAVPEASERLPEARAWIRAPAPIADEYLGAARFIHDDLQPEHLVVHPETGRLAGIIDWGPALGDPAQDFSFLTATWGWEFTRMVVEAYRSPVDSGFMTRLLFLGRVRALGWLAYGIRVGLDTSRTETVIRELLAVTDIA